MKMVIVNLNKIYLSKINFIASQSPHVMMVRQKSKLAKKVAKENLSGTTSLSNNENAKDLSDVNKHNLRDYDNQRELIRTK